MNFLLAIIKFKFASRAANLRAAQRTRKSTFPKINGTRYELQIASCISQPVVLLAPVIERRLRNPGLAAHLPDRRAFLRLPQNEGYLRFRKLRSLHRPSPFNGPESLRR
jgi:hypothetical protein